MLMLYTQNFKLVSNYCDFSLKSRGEGAKK